MRTATSKQTALWLFWACAGINVLGGVVSLVTRDVSTGEWQIGGAGLIVALGWLLQTVDRMGQALQREADAKATFAELLLAKFRETDQISVRMETPVDDHEGTKH